METITISKKEYRALKRAQRELERTAGYRAPQRRGKTLSPQEQLIHIAMTIFGAADEPESDT